jgi:hypothetical protein
MTARQNRKSRRAAERLAHKLQINVQENEPAKRLASETTEAIERETTESEPRASASGLSSPEPALERISKARLLANRANAQRSTGPISQTGKINSSKNALKTALTGRTVLLPEEDADRYEKHLLQYRKAYEPVGERECELVQSLADTTWRLDRIPGLEEALYLKGCNDFAAEVAELDPRARTSMLRMHTYLVYERQFRNLHIQEMRLHRLREKLIAEIKHLQQERDLKEQDELAMAAKLYVVAKHHREPFDPADHGFEFSTEDVEAYLHGQRASLLTEKALTAGLACAK